MAIRRNNFTRQYEHVAVIAHGAHPEYRLEFDAPLSAETADKASSIVQGSVVSVNASGNYVLGCGAGTGVVYPVPCISLKNAADPDVTAGITGSNYKTSTYSAIGGKITAIPCTGSYEIETTEFVANNSLVPGTALIPATGDDLGKLKIATAQPFKASGSEVIVGFVSKAAYTANNYGHTRLSFFANFIPVAH